MWECKWKVLRKSIKIQNKYLYPTEHVYRMTQAEILEYVLEEKMFAAIEVDISVPDDLKDRFIEMAPIFKNVSITKDDLSDHMRQFLDGENINFKSSRSLVGCLQAKNILLISPLLKWYVENGLVVADIHQIIEFQPKKCFKSFANKVTDDRRAGTHSIGYNTFPY